MTRISLISTVLDERTNLTDWLESLMAQERLPDELVIVDAGSTDGTVEALQAWATQAPFPVNVILVPGCSRSQGRNTAIAHASFDLIAVTDAGCRLHAAWLAKLSDCLGDPSVDVAAGWFRPWLETPFDLHAALVMIPALDEISPDAFLPSSRSIAFRRSAWSRVGGYPEPLNYAEDTRFDLDLKAAGSSFRFVPEAFVYWRPASSLRGLLRVARNYGFGDGQARLGAAHHRALFRYLGGSAALLFCLAAGIYAGALVILLVGGLWLLRGGLSLRRRARAFARDAASVPPLSLRELARCMAYLVLSDLARTWGYLRGCQARGIPQGSTV